jgi:hypothetical protein
MIFSPLSKVKVTPFSTTVTTANVLSPVSPVLSPVSPVWSPVVVPRVFPLYQVEVDTGLNDNPFAQKQMLDYIMAKVYNKWIYSKDMCYLLKYLKVENNKVMPIQSLENFKDNKICDDTKEVVELKIDYIEENILTKSDLKKILKRMINELGYKWYEFPQKEDVIAEAVEKYIRQSLKEKVGGY